LSNMITCAKCGKSFINSYEKCPYCGSDKTTHFTNMPEMDSGEYIIRDLEKKWNTIFNYKDVEFQGISILTTKRLIQVDKEESVITNQLALLDIANSEVGWTIMEGH